MGNCQASEAATVLIHHPGSNKVERIYWSISAHEVMSSNPGHYVALIIASPVGGRTENGLPVKQLKLLRPDDTLVMGHVYRLVSFEDVLKEFAAKKCVKLGKLLKESGGLDTKRKLPNNVPLLKLKPKLPNGNSAKGVSSQQGEQEVFQGGGDGSGRIGTSMSSRRHHNGGGGQWRPALQSIAEVGS
ncbi:hypothetical protein Leryth_010251 [Lithospermum erythrorhizon]|nr:hypothetical protein Leryth_010251 [Lithospermum erythrorhizon]